MCLGHHFAFVCFPVGQLDNDEHMANFIAALLYRGLFDLRSSEIDAVEGFFLETGWAMSFIIIGEIVTAMLRFSDATKFIMIPVYTYTGFFLTELMKINARFTGLGKG